MKTVLALVVFLLLGTCTMSQELKRDVTFNNNDTTANSSVRCIAIQADQKIIFFGDNTFYNGYWPLGNGMPINYGGRLNMDGSWDASFQGITLDGRVDDVQIQDWDQKVLIGGSFTQVNGIPRSGIARLNTDGTVDMSFNPGTGISGRWDGDLRVWSIQVKNAALPADRRIYIGGHFEYYNGTYVGLRGGVARLLENGSKDMAYDPQVTNGVVYCILLDQATDQLYVGGDFWKVAGADKIRFARLNSNGSLDNAYTIGNFWDFPDGTLTSMTLTPSGKLLIGGYFTSIKGFTRRGLCRMNLDGTVDASFNMGRGFENGGSALDNGTEVRTVLTLKDGSIIAGGNFTKYNGVSCPYIVKLEEDGRIDTDTTFGTGFNEWVTDLKVQNYAGVESRLVVGGFFTRYQGFYQGAIMRLFTMIALAQTPTAEKPPIVKPAAELAVYPNPVASVMQVKSAFTKATTCYFKLVDMNGLVIKSWRTRIAGGNQSTQFQMPPFAGKYIVLQMTDEGGYPLLITTLRARP
ncbi:delta-60 repeat domain-containing protein [Paraflavitalea sp. CAU 1676]|uniref:delta-60 repeat domain-containing protein n=1 Tax=Paraflavitalea sp. CAU 1676 TaxID=3032598 RepID=UPI0023DAC904|nr:delta-60 repeat domain-containing protein [Paraflavitalea sp. CAU 1676]MDF2189879.1 delta-60 repeat domain-containing protein [Paraflavitalea sp. CAU 1676]